VADPDLVDVFDSGYDLLCEPTGLVFLEPLSLDNVIEEFASTGILHDQEKLSRSFDDLDRIIIIFIKWTYFVKLNYVRVSDYLEYMDFSSYSFDI